MHQYWRACERSPCRLIPYPAAESVLQPVGRGPLPILCRECQAAMGVLSGGIPDTLSVLAAGLRDGDACGLYGTGGWQPAWLTAVPPGRVYVALDRDATERGIALARTFGTRGRVLIPPEDLGTKGDLNDWLRLGARAIPPRSGRFWSGRSRRVRRPGRFQIQRLPSGPGAVGSRGPSRRARPPLRDRPPRSSQPRCAPAPGSGAVRVALVTLQEGGSRVSPKHGRRAVDLERSRNRVLHFELGVRRIRMQPESAGVAWTGSMSGM